MSQRFLADEGTSIYDMIHHSINKDAFTIKFPRRCKDRCLYLFQVPLTHPQYFVIPNPIKSPNKWPLTLFYSICLIFGYTYLIVWWTYSVTMAFNLHFSIIPMILYPFGISIRDRKKFVDFQTTLKVFREERKDQDISLAETYSGPIFQITGLLGLAWFSKSIISGEPISFISNSIEYQIPLLIGVVTVKYAMLAMNRFKTSRKLFWINVGFYCVFLAIVAVIDYMI